MVSKKMGYEKIGERIKQYRIEKEISQSELARKAGMSKATVCQYESGKRTPALEQLILISNALNVSANSLLIDYIDDKMSANVNNIISRLNRLPGKEQDRYMKIVDALVSAAI